ncbi:deaminase [Singulisphaera sp. Ch08]|uniref:Deaminase n=1 Tax=Singulisphaera sp. Ch08 TaxID=3120278 RepID=A0AAU7C9I3_9BACT
MESRREFLQTVAATTAGIALTDGVAQAGPPTLPGAPAVHPPEPEEGRLKQFWNETVKDLVTLPTPQLTPAEVERHLIYCGLLSSLVVHYWNGNKRGKDGEYPWRPKQQVSNKQYQGGDYLGHNIACLAVDAEGEVIDFDFNHNEVFSSSVEHAESRLIRRIFSLTQINNGWATKGIMAPAAPTTYSNLLSDVTVYTSLESCSQCSGIMALGSVKEVVYLHRDPGQNSIGNILRQLSPEKSSFKAPLPIPADVLGFNAFTELGTAYERFAKEVGKTPFFKPTVGKPDTSNSITSFLCTDLALDIFKQAKQDFDNLQTVKYADHVPSTDDGKPVPNALTNQRVLEHARAFFAYGSTEGKRGTPHQM